MRHSITIQIHLTYIDSIVSRVEHLPAMASMVFNSDVYKYGLTTAMIDACAKRVRNIASVWLGVYARNELALLSNELGNLSIDENNENNAIKCAFVVNTKPMRCRYGGHWIAFTISHRNVMEYYCSLASVLSRRFKRELRTALPFVVKVRMPRVHEWCC